MIVDIVVPTSAFATVQRALDQINSPYSAVQLFDFALSITFFAVIGGVYIASAGDVGIAMLIFLFGGAMPFVFAYYIPLYMAHRRTLAIENNIAPFLLQAASFPAKYPITDVLRRVAREGDFGPLSKEFAVAYSQIREGMPFKDALLKIISRNDSELLSRVIHLLTHAYASGADMSHAFKETAEDVFEIQDIYRMRAAGLVIQKYTILLAAAIIVPALLAIIGGVVHNLGFGGLSDLGFSGANQDVFNMSSWGNIVYVALYSIIASVFVAYIDGSLRKAVVYAGVLLPFAFLVFYTFSAVDVFALLG